MKTPNRRKKDKMGTTFTPLVKKKSSERQKKKPCQEELLENILLLKLV